MGESRKRDNTTPNKPKPYDIVETHRGREIETCGAQRFHGETKEKALILDVKALENRSVVRGIAQREEETGGGESQRVEKEASCS